MTEQQSHKTDIWSEVASNLVDELATTRATIATQKGKLNDTWDALVKAENNVTNLIKLVAMREQEVADLTAIRTQLREMNTKQAVELAMAKQPVKWHPASEQPERWPVLVKNLEQCYHTYYHGLPCGAVRWCYIDEVK